jgi:hypothetical protein
MINEKMFKNVANHLSALSDKEKDDRLARLKKLADDEMKRRKLNPKKKPK